MEGMKTHKILIVDDDEPFRVLLRIFLMRMGVLIYEACDGTDGLPLAEKIVPDLIISDLDMVHMGGVEFIKRIRSNSNVALKDCPIIVISGASKSTQQEATDAGANVVMTKPVRAALIRDTVDLYLLRS